MANIFSVSNADELMTALASAKGGDTIELAGGDYALSAYRIGATTGEILITAADPQNPPVFEQIKLIEAQNMVFSGLTFDSTASDLAGKDLEIYRSHNITIENSIFTNASNGYFTGENDGTVQGGSLGHIRDNTGFNFSGNDVSNYAHGLYVQDSIGTVIADNTLSKMTADGVRMAGVQETLIEGNVFTSFYGSHQSINHDDMIQVWSTSNNKLNTEKLIIRDNVFNSSDGAGSQTIFIKNENFGETGTKFRDITIEDNTIYNGHQNAVVVYNTVGVTVQNNTLLWNSDAFIQSTPESTPVTGVPRIKLFDVEGGLIAGNIAGGITAVGNTVTDNAILNFTNPEAENYVNNHFVNAMHAGAIDLRDMALLSDSAWNGQFGSSAIQSNDKTGPLTAVISQEQDGEIFGRVTYDASQSYGPDGLLPDETTQYTWSFPDGTVLTGERVTHDFSSDGLQEIMLKAHTDFGTSDVTRSTKIAPDLLVSIDFDGEIKDGSTYESSLAEIGNREDATGFTGDGFHLNGSNKLQIEWENGHIHNMSAFTIDLSLKRDTGGDAGTFLHQHGTLAASIREDGSIGFALKTTEGSFLVQTETGLITDNQWHQISLSFAPNNGGLRIHLDGALAAEAAATGVVSSSGTGHDLVIGNSWNDSLQGTIDNFSLRKSVDDGSETLVGPENPSEITSGDDSTVDRSETIIQDPTETEKTTTSPEKEPELTEPMEEPAPAEESSLPELLLKGGYQLDIASVATSDTVKLGDDAHVTEGGSLSFDGKKDYVSLGRLTEFETSQKIGFSVDFVSESDGDGSERLVWNHQKVGLTLEGDGLRIHVQNNDDRFHKGFQIEGLGLDDGNRHTATVMVDAEVDRLQVVVNEDLVLDERDTDFDFVGAGGHEWGWSLGTAWNRWFEGEVHDFQVSDDFSFQGSAPADESALLS